MKKSIYLFAAIATLFTAACGEYKTTDKGLKYRIITHEDGARGVGNDSSMFVYANYGFAVASTDSVIGETFTKNTPTYIPVNEPNFGSGLMLLSVGDSAEMICDADSFFMNSFGQQRPEWVKQGDQIKFKLKVIDIIDQKEVMRKMDEMRQEENEKMQKQMEAMDHLRVQDSISSAEFLSTLRNVKKTASGVHYVVEKEGNGKPAKKGSRVAVLYKGYLLNGQVFDENRQDGYNFVIGADPVIPGWVDVLETMKEGSKIKAVIPWNLAYGPRGDRSIPPFSTLVFEMELAKVE